MPLFNIKIQGRPAIKKNNHRILKRGRGLFIAPSAKYRAWEMEIVGRLMQRKYEPIAEPMEMHIAFHFKNHQHEADTSNLIEGPQDVLQKVGIISNDKLIRKIVAEKIFSGEEYFEITLFRYETAKSVDE